MFRIVQGLDTKTKRPNTRDQLILSKQVYKPFHTIQIILRQFG